ncbi:ParA family protein [Aetokthonos hydrillicola Thurmond2011]|uniref:ParA family protein n=1 Tax=Aetokthonos hydrillicola Thurmond2011 TaxID=2712845 RepID=A0AAP5IFA0_9CYAN|nr:ParA family protein [Aetokthonos hydrillicola]MBO3463454.1 ParA family protein [Aetokthonos hydrillicola CCALA 1050]MBW4591168.1 ParA family protein [Aetokthonos hydrillicola CCALA 1050]MDR9900535.1 ParA family protein [Aetokthonos hydrillicola Thurmond2011]
MTNTRLIAVFNQSGGVAKTTLTQNLGYHLAQKKHQVLLVDMDPQASLTNFMGIEPEEQKKTIYHAIIEEEPITLYPETIHGMKLAPSNINLSVAELLLPGVTAREYRLSEALDPIKSDFDFILIDCPPSLGILSILSLTAATHILVPIQCQFKSFLGTDLLLDTVERVHKKLNKGLQFAGFVPTMLDNRTAQESRTAKAVSEQLAKIGTVYPPIPKSIAFADASERRMPLALFDKSHPAVKVLKTITSGLEKLKVKETS